VSLRTQAPDEVSRKMTDSAQILYESLLLWISKRTCACGLERSRFQAWSCGGNSAAGQNEQIMCEDAGTDGRLKVLPSLGEAA
jgi:hypothetical protein